MPDADGKPRKHHYRPRYSTPPPKRPDFDHALHTETARAHRAFFERRGITPGPVSRTTVDYDAVRWAERHVLGRIL